jgi:hypothetical protein
MIFVGRSQQKVSVIDDRLDSRDLGRREQRRYRAAGRADRRFSIGMRSSSGPAPMVGRYQE